MEWLTEPFALSFMQRALVASVFVGLVCSVLGCYVVLRSMAFLGDALAHAVRPGLARAIAGERSGEREVLRPQLDHAARS